MTQQDLSGKSGPSGHQEHFDHIASKYKQASDTWEPVYRQIESFTEARITGKDIVDIGNGGYFPYRIEAAKSVTVVDISPEMLDRIQADGIFKVVDDAVTLSKISDHSCDIMIYCLCLHHIHGKNLNESEKLLTSILKTARQKLRSGGSVLIAEPVMTGFWSVFQRLMFPVTRFILSLKKVPMIYFYHPNNLISSARHAFGEKAEITSEEIRVEGWVDPMGGSFPGLIKIPAALCPTRYFVFEIKAV